MRKRMSCTLRKVFDCSMFSHFDRLTNYHDFQSLWILLLCTAEEGYINGQINTAFLAKFSYNFVCFRFSGKGSHDVLIAIWKLRVSHRIHRGIPIPFFLKRLLPKQIYILRISLDIFI